MPLCFHSFMCGLFSSFDGGVNLPGGVLCGLCCDGPQRSSLALTACQNRPPLLAAGDPRRLPWVARARQSSANTNINAYAAVLLSWLRFLSEDRSHFWNKGSSDQKGPRLARRQRTGNAQSRNATARRRRRQLRNRRDGGMIAASDRSRPVRAGVQPSRYIAHVNALQTINREILLNARKLFAIPSCCWHGLSKCG